MGVVYVDRPIVEEKVAEKADAQVSEGGQQTRRLGRAAGKRKAREPADVRIGCELAKPVERKSRKVSFYLSEYTGEVSCSDMVSWA